MNKRLKGNTATMPLTNSSSLTIKIVDSNNIEYQFNSSEYGKIHTTEIEYVECGEDEELQAAFRIEGELYYLKDFCKDKLI